MNIVFLSSCVKMNMFVQSLLSSFVVAALFNEAVTVTITVKNNCPWTLWPGVYPLYDSGFELTAGATHDLQVPHGWASGRIWARTQCDSGPTCVTGDCGSGAGRCDGRTGAPPATLAEFTLNGDRDQDFFDVSNVDGFNIPISIQPQGGYGDKCRTTSCSTNINYVCPSELAVRNNNGDVVGCKSACEAFKEPRYCCTAEALTATITIKNNCPWTLWPGVMPLSDSGFELPSGNTHDLQVPHGWQAGRIWARTQCDSGPTCVTGDCGSGGGPCDGRGGAPPVTLAELTLNGDGDQDFYDVSNVDGFNIPVSIQPQGGSGDKCQTTSCSNNINSVCPAELAVHNQNGDVVGCKSACLAFNQPQYCCTGDYSTPDKCPPTDYSKIFKGQCPQAYSYAYDDRSSTFICSGSPNYVVTFCP